MGDPAGGGGAPGGGGTERKLVTVLAVDLDEPVEGFDERDPEDVRAMLAGHLDRVRAEVEGFGGSIEHAAAGRALAVFGVPRTHEDDAERAVRAALTIRDALAAAAPTLRVHLAVAGGEAVVRLDPQAAGQRVSGAPIGLCTRLLETVPAGGVLVAESSARVTEAAIAYGPSSSVALPGGRAVTVRPALDPRPPGLDLPARHATPLVGRASELDALLGQLARVRATHSPKLLVLVGPPGIGKSRLAGELARVAAEDQPETAAWRGGRSLPYGDGVTFSALAEIVRAEAGIREGDPPDRVLAKLTAAAGRAVPEPDIALWVAGHLRRLVSVDGLTEPGGADRAEAFAAWRRFLDGLAANRPLVLLVEDLHWADDALLDFLEALAAPPPCWCSPPPDRSCWNAGPTGQPPQRRQPARQATAAASPSCRSGRCPTGTPPGCSSCCWNATSCPRGPPAGWRAGSAATRCSSRSTCACCTTAGSRPGRAGPTSGRRSASALRTWQRPHRRACR